MRLSLRITFLMLVSAVLVLGVTSVAAAKGGPPKPLPPKSNSPHAAEAQDSAQAPAAPAEAPAVAPAPGPAAAGSGAVTQHGGCLTSDPTVTGSGSVILNPNGATNFNCHGKLPAGSPAPDRPVKVSDGDCDTVLTPSGRVRTICHSRP